LESVKYQKNSAYIGKIQINQITSP